MFVLLKRFLIGVFAFGISIVRLGLACCGFGRPSLGFRTQGCCLGPKPKTLNPNP